MNLFFKIKITIKKFKIKYWKLLNPRNQIFYFWDITVEKVSKSKINIKRDVTILGKTVYNTIFNTRSPIVLVKYFYARNEMVINFIIFDLL